jgi:hypothetical protein
VFYQSLERLRNSLGFWYSEFSHISFGIRFKVQICPDSLIYLELIFSSIPLLVIITPEPSVRWGHSCSLWKGLKILYILCGFPDSGLVSVSRVLRDRRQSKQNQS